MDRPPPTPGAKGAAREVPAIDAAESSGAERNEKERRTALAGSGKKLPFAKRPHFGQSDPAFLKMEPRTSMKIVRSARNMRHDGRCKTACLRALRHPHKQ